MIQGLLIYSGRYFKYQVPLIVSLHAVLNDTSLKHHVWHGHFSFDASDESVFHVIVRPSSSVIIPSYEFLEAFAEEFQREGIMIVLPKIE